MIRHFLYTISTFILFLLIPLTASTQTLDDALRYSIHEYNSTARFAGVSGAFSPLGADVSIASVNPAGIAEFRKSEVTATINYFKTQNESNLDGSILNRSASQIGLGNIAAVFHQRPFSDNIKTFNLAIGFNQITNYKETFEYSGTGSGTIVQRFLEQANGRTLDELGNFEAGPAYDAEAIFGPDDLGNYDSDFVTLTETVSRNEVVERTGSLNEVFIAIGSNIKNKLSWGATLGFPFAKFTESRRYDESDSDDNIAGFNSLDFNQNLNTSGVGFNLKVGFIYKPIPRLRVGAAIHSKSYFLLTDEFDTDIAYSYRADGADTDTNNSALSPLSSFEYELQGPWRALAGIGYLYSFGDFKGFVSGEIEYVKYNSAKFNLTKNSTDPLDQFFEDDLNNEVTGFLGSALNYRMGTELAYKMARIRLGASLQKSPFQEATILEYDPSFSVGLGYRGNKYYVDAALTARSSSTNYSPYSLLDIDREPLVGLKQSRAIVTLTFGSKL